MLKIYIKSNSCKPFEICFSSYSDEISGQVGKPRFLMQLEGYLKRELQALDLQQPKVQERRLQV